MKMLIDSDIILYKVGFAVENESKFLVKNTLDKYINSLIKDSGCTSYQHYLTGKDNFRNIVSSTYKANRKDTPKPKHYAHIRKLLIRDWKAEVIDGMECDDALGLNQTDKTFIATIDKDLLMVSGLHFNMNSREFTTITDEQGDRFFYKQVLTGDNVDNIKAIKGIGTKTADKLLDAIDRSEWDAMIMSKYEEHFKDQEGKQWYQRFVENTQLLWILNKREIPIEIRGDYI
jgi:5'-3' exonuclease